MELIILGLIYLSLADCMKQMLLLRNIQELLDVIGTNRRLFSRYFSRLLNFVVGDKFLELGLV